MEKERLTTIKSNEKAKTDKRKEKESLAISLIMELNAEQLESFVKKHGCGQQGTDFKT